MRRLRRRVVPKAAGAAMAVGLAALAAAPTASAQLLPLSSFSAGTVAEHVAIDAGGSLYLPELFNDRISVYTDRGAFVRTIGSSGSGAGQLDQPQGIAVDGVGNLYVAEGNNDRISVFTTSGAFVRAFGWGVDTGVSGFESCTSASGCQGGLAGGGGGQLNDPHGLGLSPGGSLVVADQVNQRISVFNPSVPAFTRAFGWGVDTGAAQFETCTTATGCLPGSVGGGAGQLSNPLDVEVDADGSVHVPDYSNNRISVFGPLGPGVDFIEAYGWGVDTGAAAFQTCTTASGCQQGVQGAGAGQLSLPRAISVSGDGTVFVTDSSNNRVSIFEKTTPQFFLALGWGVDTGAAQYEDCTAASGCQVGIAGTGAGQFNHPQGLALDCRGAFWVSHGAGVLQRIGELGREPCSPPPAPPPPAPATTPGFDLAAAIKRCKKKFPKGQKRKRCIRRARDRAGA